MQYPYQGTDTSFTDIKPLTAMNDMKTANGCCGGHDDKAGGNIHVQTGQERPEHAYGAEEGVTDREVEKAVCRVNPDKSSIDSRG